MTKLNIILLGTFLCNSCLAQIYDKSSLYPDIAEIITKYPNSYSINKKVERLDSLGRIISEHNFHNDSLLSQMRFIYDNQNNRIAEYRTFDMNIPDIVNTNLYTYTYNEEHRITSQVLRSTVVKHEEYSLINNDGDSLLTYLRISNCDSSLLTIKYNTDGYEKEFTRSDLSNTQASTYLVQYDARGSVIEVDVIYKMKDSTRQAPLRTTNNRYWHAYYDDGLVKEWFQIFENDFPYYKVDTTLISEIEYIKKE
jgi:hypothetical protein